MIKNTTKFAVFAPNCFMTSISAGGYDTVVFQIITVFDEEDPLNVALKKLDPEDQYNLDIYDADAFLAARFGVDKIIYSSGKRPEA